MMVQSLYASTITKKTPTCIDLFCGAGGLSLGFCQAGGIPIAAIDFDNDSIETYKNMFSICPDVHCIKIEDWCELKNSYSVDCIIGGPPCQGFSNAGKRVIDDERNKLYKYFLRTVERYSPEWFVMENVPGIVSIGDGVVLRQIYEDFTALGYTVCHKVINMAEYGVPQTRKRTVFVGNKKGLDFEWPLPHYIKYKEVETYNDTIHFVSVQSAIGDLAWPQGNYFSHRANSQMRGPRNRDVKFYPAFTLRVRGDEFALCEEPATGAFPPGATPTGELAYLPIQSHYQSKMREVPPYWVDVSSITFANLDVAKKLIGTRKLTVREQARLQSFPDWFEFAGVPYSQSKQIGNAVPPVFAHQLFARIFKYLCTEY
jgi:DNA (cytosine-5)-methyltransferase 1